MRPLLAALTLAPGLFGAAAEDGGLFFGAKWWEAVGALGTSGATLVALALALSSWLGQRRTARSEKVRDASLVSSWTETSVEPNETRDAYILRASVFLANESDRPVFSVHVVVGVPGDRLGEVVQLGSVSLPDVVWTLPSRHRREWDITMGLMAMTSEDQFGRLEPLCKVAFSDGEGNRWLRDWDGDTSLMQPDREQPSTLLDRDSERANAQLGDLENWFNPMAVVWQFRESLLAVDDDNALEAIRALCHLERWGGLEAADLEDMRAVFADWGFATNVRYVAPRACYVMFLPPEEASRQVERSGLTGVEALFVTLIWLPEVGWQIYGIADSTPRTDWLKFPPGALTDDPRG